MQHADRYRARGVQLSEARYINESVKGNIYCTFPDLLSTMFISKKNLRLRDSNAVSIA